MGYASSTFGTPTTQETTPSASITVIYPSFLFYSMKTADPYRSAQALLSPTTTLEDVLFGLYSWLDNHPTEAVLVSMNHEGGTGTPDDAALQEHLYNIFNGDLAKRYWVQANGTVRAPTPSIFFILIISAARHPRPSARETHTPSTIYIYPSSSHFNEKDRHPPR